jgi:hypothetical protein
LLAETSKAFFITNLKIKKMKKILLLAITLLSIASIAQEKFTEGIITMKQTMDSPNETVKAQLEMMGDMLTTTYLKGMKSRTESNSPMTGDIIVIIDSESKNMLQLMDIPGMGKKFLTQKMELTEEMINNITVTEGSETKNVLGYDLKHYIVTIAQEGAPIKMELFTTDKIDSVMTQQTAVLGDKIKGYPLYMVMTMTQMGAEMIVTSEVTEIKSEPVADGKLSLTPPEGYTEIQM